MLSVAVAVPIASLSPVEGTIAKQQVTYTEQYIESAYVEPIVESIAEIDEPEQLTFSLSCQCVAYVRIYTDNKFNGNARDWDKYINQAFPSRGSIIVINTSLGHIGVTFDYGKDTVTFRSQNWSAPCVVEDVTISRDDPRILGYIHF